MGMNSLGANSLFADSFGVNSVSSNFQFLHSVAAIFPQRPFKENIMCQTSICSQGSRCRRQLVVRLTTMHGNGFFVDAPIHVDILDSERLSLPPTTILQGRYQNWESTLQSGTADNLRC